MNLAHSLSFNRKKIIFRRPAKAQISMSSKPWRFYSGSFVCLFPSTKIPSMPILNIHVNAQSQTPLLYSPACCSGRARNAAPLQRHAAPVRVKMGDEGSAEKMGDGWTGQVCETRGRPQWLGAQNGRRGCRGCGQNRGTRVIQLTKV